MHDSRWFGRVRNGESRVAPKVEGRGRGWTLDARRSMLGFPAAARCRLNRQARSLPYIFFYLLSSKF